MAVCKRCGATFDYNQREGVCPKCCFYNRPANAWQDDDSWIKNYNYEDNSYDIRNRESGPSDKNSGDRLTDIILGRKESGKTFSMPDHGGSKDLEGSHTHLDNGRVVPGNRKKTVPQGRGPSTGRKNGKGTLWVVLIFIFWMYFLISMIMGFVMR